MGKGARNRQVQREAAAKSKKKQDSVLGLGAKIGLWAVAAAVVLVFLYSVLTFTGTIQRGLTAAKVGNEKVSAMDFNILYRDVRSNILNEYGPSLQQYYNYDLTTIDSQPCIFDTSITWREYFIDQTKEQVKTLYTLYQDGRSNGFELSDEDNTEYQDYMAQIESNADYNGMSLAQYVKAAYSSATKLSDVEKVNKIRFYGNAYYNHLKDQYNFGDTDVETYYQEHQDDFDVVDYYYYTFPYTTYTYTEPEEGAEIEEGQPKSEEEATSMTEASKSEAKALADEMRSKVTGADNFETVAEAYHIQLGNENYSSHFNQGVRVNEQSGSTSDWYREEGRQVGDIDVVDTGFGYSVLLFAGRYREELPTVRVRHILLRTEAYAEDATDEDKAAVDEANAAVLTQIEDIRSQWESGEATEDSFAALAKEHSADGSASEGGDLGFFTENVMVQAFNDWCFESGRKPGDVGLVETTYGYHLIYFVEHGNYEYYNTIVDTLTNNAMDEYMENTMPNYPADFNDYPVSLAS